MRNRIIDVETVYRS